MEGFQILLSLAAAGAFWLALWALAVRATPGLRRRRGDHGLDR
jgi:hypothetical protein